MPDGALCSAGFVYLCDANIKSSSDYWPWFDVVCERESLHFDLSTCIMYAFAVLCITQQATLKCCVTLLLAN